MFSHLKMNAFFIRQSMNSFFIYQCTDYKLNVVAFISEVLYVYYVIDNKEVVSTETHRLPFSITHQRSTANVRHVLINIFNVKTTSGVWCQICMCCSPEIRGTSHFSRTEYTMLLTFHEHQIYVNP